MSYLLAEIIVYLIGAGLIGFVVGWFVRGTINNNVGREDKSSSQELVLSESIVVESELKETETEDNKVDVSSSDELIKVKEVLKDEENEASVKPILLTEAPKEGADKLSTIKGIGPVLERKLNELGIYSFEQIASWDEKQELWIGTQMAFPKRVTREAWVKQAKELLKNK